MINNNTDTITAISTPIGRGGIGIIRISGKLAPEISLKIFNKIPKPRQAEYLPFLDQNGSIIERVIALFFPEPYSFTGENILEIHGHGGQFILELLIDRILETNTKIRLANPGEFTERAFLNGKIDLIQAEAIADIIDATSSQAAKSACYSLQGSFSKKIKIILKKLTQFRTHIESSIDFSDHEINFMSNNHIKQTLQNIIQSVKETYQSACSGVLLRDGIKIVIAGKPNAGKSSLFNALIGIDRAIVSKIPGTTRDTIHEYMHLCGITFHLIDTAGLQKNSTNEVELIGIQRTQKELTEANHILWVIDTNHTNNDYDILNTIQQISLNIQHKVPITIVRNKSDLSLEKNRIYTIDNKYTCVVVSALLDQGINLLKKHLHDFAKLNTQQHNFNHVNGENQGKFIARKRHVNILKKVSQYLISAYNQLDNNKIIINDCFAEDLKQAHNELNKILGKFTTENLLQEIFNSFCIGK